MENKTKYIIAACALVVLAVAVYFLFIFQKSDKISKSEEAVNEVKQISDISVDKRPYVTLTPTTDGAEIIISIENMRDFDRVEYELTYQADNPQVSGEKIQRGSTGTDVNAKEGKYKKSLLLGTASRGVRSPDKGIEDGKLTLHLFKGSTEYQSETNWDRLQVGSTNTVLKDRDGKFSLAVGNLGKDYWVIIADTVGVPAGGSFDVKSVSFPVYGFFAVAPDFSKKADLSITLSSDVANSTLYSYRGQDSKWDKLDSKYDAATKTITSSVNSFATFVVVSSK